MSWAAYIVDKDGNFVQCGKCTHNGSCKVVEAAPAIAHLLTSVDICCDGTVASGRAKLQCDAFNAKPEDVDDSIDKAAEEDAGADIM